MQDYKQGDLVIFQIKDKRYTPEGFAAGGVTFLDSDKKMTVYSSIDLEEFPSFRDFKGNSIIVKDGEVAMVLKKVGRPSNILKCHKWDIYDVYEVLIGKFKAQVFKFNLKLQKPIT